jgi:hypothetical protein
MPSIQFKIHNGNVTIKAIGFKGTACEAATKAFEEVLGGEVVNKTRTADYYEEVEEPKIKIGGAYGPE